MSAVPGHQEHLFRRSDAKDIQVNSFEGAFDDCDRIRWDEARTSPEQPR